MGPQVNKEKESREKAKNNNKKILIYNITLSLIFKNKATDVLSMEYTLPGI